ncbi:zinc finger protein 804A-like [Oncorhynchus clarkii lewisi]|uniref:zinc finger protein 804A-like n=1 Tax=Oncorhynchus clarkii lewisi TaxID=490388 RepID=UPI0039B91F4F
MACYYIVISSTHLSNGHFRNIKGVFRGPLSKNGNKNLDYAEKERTTTMAKALEDLKANFYCDLCDKQYYKHQEFDNHINSYDHAHKQRLKELKQREFARNVASKTRKDERKQERALQRLHELAEQRREVQCAPGSGPKFKSTTVAVDASCRESRTDGLSGESHNSTVLETGTHNHTTGTSTGLASNSKTQQTSYWPYNGKAKKQTYKRHKIAFSFSFPKKASVKLDSAAAVFCENTEEGSKERTGTRKLRIPLVELNVPVSTTAEEKGQGFAGVEINGTKPGDLSPNGVSEGSQKSSDTLSRSDIPMPPQASHLYSVLVNSEDIARHYVSSVSQLPASLCHIPLDDPDTVLDTQNSEETQRNGSTEAEPETSKQQQVHKVERSVSREENFSISSSDGPPENVSSSSSQSSERPGTAREKGEDSTVVVKTLSGPFTKPSQPFFSVLSKDGYTVLQWPSEMLTFTRTEPRLSYSCNPLHFDFKASQQSRAKVRTGDSQSKTEPRLSEALCIGSTSVCSEELIDNKHNKEAYSRPDHHIPIRVDRETVERKDCLICDHHMSDIDTESCSLQLKRHGRVYSSGKSSSQSKDQTGKRAAGIKKWKSRDRRHYRSHKKKKRRRRRRRRGGYEEERHRETETDGGVESDAEKCNKFQRQSECHNVHISDPPVGHNVHISDLPVGHNVHISDLPVGHNVHISDLPVGHNVHISDLPVGHNVHMAEPPVDVKSDDRCKMKIQNLMNTDVEYSVVKGPLASCSALSQPAVEHSSKPMGGSPRLQIQNSVPSIKEDKMGNNGEDCITRQTVTVAAHVSPLGAREITPPFITPQRFQIQNTGPDKSCQHSFQSYPNRQRCYPGIRVNDETGIREGLRPGGLNITGSLCSPYHRPASYHNHRPPSFHPQHPSDGMEKHHCVIQIQTHRHILHHHRQHQVFPGKMKPVLPGSPVPMSPSCPPMLHPVHLSPVPNGSITIQHTILHHQHHHAYHHAAFLPPHPQPPLFPQVLPVPVSRRPMGADMCPPGPSPFLTSTPHLSVVAPPSLHHHPMAVTFHAMPRPTMFPPSMLQSHPHPTVIPLQPMF